jgi:hypothetical protein
MIDQKQIDQFRRMTPAERWAMSVELSELGMAIWEQNLSREDIERRWAIWRRDHDLSDAKMLRGFREAAARASARTPPPPEGER